MWVPQVGPTVDPRDPQVGPTVDSWDPQVGYGPIVGPVGPTNVGPTSGPTVDPRDPQVGPTGGPRRTQQCGSHKWAPL